MKVSFEARENANASPREEAGVRGVMPAHAAGDE
jgi:hypothetical protein